MGFDPISLSLSKNYTAESVKGMGAIKGEKGDPGPQGPVGPKGDPGKDATINGKNAIALAPGRNVTIETGDDGTVTISAAGGGAGESVTAGDGLSKDGYTLNVDNPVRGIYTQAEFAALTAEQKASGTYFVDDGQGGSSGWETYSTEGRRIGTWIDGKPIYRKVVIGTLPSSRDQIIESDHISDFDCLISMIAVSDLGGENYAFPYYSTSGYANVTLRSDGTFWFLGTHPSFFGKSITCIVEYTKTTD